MTSTKSLKQYVTGTTIVLLVLISLVFGGGSGFLVSRYLNPAREIDGGQTIKEIKTVEKNTYIEESSMTEAVQRVSPSVISIVATKDLTTYYQSPFPFFFNDPLLDDLLRRQGFIIPGQPNSGNGSKTERKQIGGGTGFIFTTDGLVLTNRHVVADKEADYTAVSYDGTEYTVEVVSIDTVLDIAFLRLNDKGGKPASNLPAVEFGDSDKLKIGQRVLAIGNAKAQYENTVTAGIISAVGREIVAGDSSGNSQKLEGLLQTDAAINPGNSGGPLINLLGQVVGINTAIDASASGIGFAIPIDDVKPLIKSIEEHGYIIRPRLGVRYRMLTEAIAKELSIPLEHGALLVGDSAKGEFAVLPGSPADKAGLEMGDVILQVNKEDVTINNTLQNLVKKYKVGDEISIKVWHKSKEKIVSVKLDEMPTK